MMSRAVKAATLVSQAGGLQLRAALFHSTPVLERKRRNFWDHKSTYSSRKSRKLHAKHTLLRDMNAFAEQIFQGWKNDLGDEDPSSSGAQYSKWSRGNCNSNQGNRRSRRRSFQFYEDDEIEDIFGPAFGGKSNFNWSFANDENPQWEQSSDYSNKYRAQWRHQSEGNSDSSSSASKLSGSNLAFDRLALGLDASGPLNLEDVKKAYRACALKWHPDRHQGSSKVPTFSYHLVGIVIHSAQEERTSIYINGCPIVSSKSTFLKECMSAKHSQLFRPFRLQLLIAAIIVLFGIRVFFFYCTAPCPCPGAMNHTTTTRAPRGS